MLPFVIGTGLPRDILFSIATQYLESEGHVVGFSEIEIPV